MNLKKNSCDVGIYFGSFRVYSVKIGKKNVSDAFRKTTGASVSGRHNDDRWRNAPGVFHAYVRLSACVSACVRERVFVYPARIDKNINIWIEGLLAFICRFFSNVHFYACFF